MPEPLTVKFEGGLAERHMFPLYYGGETLSGIGLIFTRVSHYMLTGEVRHRAPYDSRLQIITRPPRDGSVEFDFIGYLAGPAPVSIIGQVVIGVTASSICAAGIYLVKKLIGQAAEPPDSIRELEEQRPGDIDALSSAILPSLKKSHSIINHGAGSININGDHNKIVLNNETKEYVNTSIREENDLWIDGSVGWLNANQRTGGAFIYEQGRIIPFDMSKNISVESLKALSFSQSEYLLGNKEKSRIALRVLAIRAIDGKLKRYLLIEANLIEEN